MTRHKKTKKQYLKLITQYGIHIWAILIIANAAMVYAYQFATHAANKSDTTLHALDVSLTPSPSLSPSPSVTAAPLGPTINLQFTVPGIGSGGGVMKPLHPKRNVTVYLYAPDVNSMNPTVKPLYTIQTTAAFDFDPYSPTYTSFINPQIDLGAGIKDANYQIAFRTDQSLHTLIKQNPSDLGGEMFDISGGPGQAIVLPSQTVLMGDTIPSQGDNTININDYNAFVTCYGPLNATNSFCKTGNFGDFNDDGVIDGIDYNILVRSLYVLSQQGLAVPEITPSQEPSSPPIAKVTHPVRPTTTVKKQPTPTPASTGTKGSLTGVLFFIFFLIILGGIGFFLYIKNEKVHTLINSLIHLSPTGTPSSQPTETTDKTEQTSETSTEEPETPTQPTETEQPVTQPNPSTLGEALEKDCYIKTKEKDEAGSGMWLLLTDDNGAINAHYAKTDATDGFAKVKGIMKEENGKKFLEISELTMEG